jgi:uncharacterized membrane protein
MKNLKHLFSAIIIVVLFSNFTLNKQITSEPVNPGNDYKYHIPSKINTIIQKSCYGCHNVDSENEKAKKKLDFDKIGEEYNSIKSAGKLKDIAKAILNNDMPPEKFLEHNSEKTLTDHERQIFSDWATFVSNKFSEKK